MAPSQAAKLFRLSPAERQQLDAARETLLSRGDEIVDRLVGVLSMLPGGAGLLRRSHRPGKNRDRFQNWLGKVLRPWRHPRREPFLKHLFVFCARRGLPLSHVSSTLECAEQVCLEALSSAGNAEAGQAVSKRFAAERLALASLYVEQMRLQESRQQANLRRWIDTRSERLNSTVSLNRALSQEIDETEAVRVLARHVIETFSPDLLVIHLISPEGVVETPLMVSSGRPEARDDDERMQALRRNAQLCPAVRSCEAFYVEDVSNVLVRCPKQAWPQERGSHCCVPLTNGTHVVGWMHLRRGGVRAFTAEEIEVLSIYGQMVGTSVRSLRLLNENRHQATTDALTGLQNRRHFEDVLRKETLLVQRRKGKASILMLDLDSFKQLNDTYGHDIGDRALVGVGQAIQKSVRRSDETARLGGDEFVMLLRDCSGDDAAKVAEKVTAAVRGLDIYTDHPTPARVGVSVGIATCPEDAPSLDTAMLMADVALLRAKESGRGQWMRYDPGRDERVTDSQGYGREASR
jgi:diguanylate cyclase (GGDEF)-like protein